MGWWGATRTTRFEIGGCNRQLLCIPPLRARMQGLPVAHLQERLVFPAYPLTLEERFLHLANPLTDQQRVAYLATPFPDGQRRCHGTPYSPPHHPSLSHHLDLPGHDCKWVRTGMRMGWEMNCGNGAVVTARYPRNRPPSPSTFLQGTQELRADLISCCHRADLHTRLMHKAASNKGLMHATSACRKCWTSGCNHAL